jgi:hypothetical protein
MLYKSIFKFLGVVAVIVMITCSFKRIWNSPVKGSVNPTNSASRVWMFSTSDTLTAPVIQGQFMITDVKSGNYILMLESIPPYRDNIRQDIVVTDGQMTDVGVIEMIK